MKTGQSRAWLLIDRGKTRPLPKTDVGIIGIRLTGRERQRAPKDSEPGYSVSTMLMKNMDVSQPPDPWTAVIPMLATRLKPPLCLPCASARRQTPCLRTNGME